MLKKLLLALPLFCIAYSLSAQVCNFSYRKRITFDPTKVGAAASTTDLTNFPALINISSDNDLRVTASGGYVTNSNGYDIIFTSDDGVTQLNHQLEKYVSTTGELVVWVNIPTLSTSINTYIYMYYGNSGIATDQSTTNTWSNNYYGVWHTHNNSMTDNSGNSYTLTNNSTTNQSPAKVADGRALSGTQWLEVANTFPNITSNFTISGWVYTTDNTKAGQRVFCDDVNNTGGYALSLGDGGTGMLRFYSRNSNPVILDGPSNQIANNTWYYVSAVADITNGRKTIYVNGVQAATATFTNAWGTDNGNSSIGGETASGETANRLKGRLDEVRVAKSALSADWLLTEYNNQNSPSTFYSVSAHPKVWLGSTNTNWNAAANWQGNNLPNSGDDVVITNGTNQPTLNVNQQVGGIWIKNGATLSLSSNTLSVRFDITNCGTITGNTSTVTCNSTSAYAQNQYFSGTGTYNLNDLTVNNTYTTSPKLILNKDVNVAGAVTLTSAIVYTTATNVLAMGNSATTSSGSATSFVSGPMSKSGSANIIFPVGKGSRWRRAALTNITANTTFTVEYFDTPYSNTTSVNSPLNNVSVLEYWQIDRTSGSGNGNITLYWEDAGTSGINDCPDLTMARWNGASWDERPATTSGASVCSGTGAGTLVTNSAITAFSPFTFASKSNSLNPLPIELISFEALPNGSKVDLKWATASEHNNDYFTIEKTKDGQSFEFVAQVDGAGNSSSILNYSSEDLNPYIGTSYYRLRQTDYNGDQSYSDLVEVKFVTVGDFGFYVYPNPVASGENLNITIQNSPNEEVLVVVTDVTGKESYSKVIITGETGETVSALDIENRLAPGIYLITATSKQNIFSKKLIIK